jgi:hypothetical protein
MRVRISPKGQTMSCISILTPEARVRFLSDEAKNERLSWLTPEIISSKRQQKRMTKLAHSDKVSDRVVAAGSPSAPLYILSLLAMDPESKVRGWVVRNPAVRKETLRFLCGDEDKGIAAYAKFRLDGLAYHPVS